MGAKSKETCGNGKILTVFLWLWHFFKIIVVSNVLFLSFYTLHKFNLFQFQKKLLKGVFYLISWSATKYNFCKGEGGKPISDIWLTRGGGWVWTPPFLADIMCERPLIVAWNWLTLAVQCTLQCSEDHRIVIHSNQKNIQFIL